jgi:hypothetical protein
MGELASIPDIIILTKWVLGASFLDCAKIFGYNMSSFTSLIYIIIYQGGKRWLNPNLPSMSK